MPEAGAKPAPGAYAVAPVSLSDSEARGRWDAFVAGRPDATLYHGTRWLRVVAEAFGRPLRMLQATAGEGRVAGILPAVEIRSRLLGHRLVSLPYCNYGGPVAETEAAAEALRQEAVGLARAAGASLELRELGAPLAGWETRSDKVVLVLPLPADAEALGEAIGSKRRSQIRRPLKEGAEVAHGGAELLPEFYRVFCKNMRDLGTPVYPWRFFEAIGRHLADAMHVVVVRVADRPAAAALLLRWRDRMEIPWASSLREHNRIGVNMLLYWEALTHAMESGCAAFDFGRSTRDSGTYRFKKQWGAEPVDCRWLYWPEGAAGAGEAGRLRRWGSAAWSRLPLPVANRVGPWIAPSLPW